MEKHIFTYGNYSYEYYLARQARKTISLIVEPCLRIVLKCPVDCSDEKIQKFLKNKWKWLERQLSYFKKFSSKINKREYVSGESFLYLGRQYKLYIKKGGEDDVKLKFGRILLRTTRKTDNKKYNKKLLKGWYAERTFKIFQDQHKKVLKNFDYDFEPKLITRKMNKRWGSFLNHKKIILNPALIQAPKECIDYVIAHELCHMKYKNHNKKFYGLLKSRIRNWEEVKEKLELRFL